MPGSQPADEAEPGGQRPDSRLDDTSPWVSYAGLFFLVAATVVATVIAFFSTCTLVFVAGLHLDIMSGWLLLLALVLAVVVAFLFLWFVLVRWVEPLWRRIQSQNRRHGWSQEPDAIPPVTVHTAGGDALRSVPSREFPSQQVTPGRSSETPPGDPAR